MKKILTLFFLALTLFFLMGCQDEPLQQARYTITFKVEDATYFEYETLADAQMMYPANPVKEGYVFVGWYLDGQPFDDTLIPDENAILEAVFEEVNAAVTTYEVDFYDGTTLLLTIEIEENEVLDQTDLPETEKTNYTFDGWYLNSTFTVSFDLDDPITTNLSIYGKWTYIPQTGTGDYSGYYQSLNGLADAALENALRSLIKNTGYATGSTNQVKEADKWQGSYYLIYTGLGSYGNREHVWPNSKLGSAPKYDLHNLRAANSDVNSARSNYPFGPGSGGWKLSGGKFYPGDDHVGDVARIVLYIHVRYNLSITLVGNLDMFLTWHQEDPVDDFERTRNDRIYNIQNNRNPFIDHPDLVYALWPSAQTSTIEIEIPHFNLNYPTNDAFQSFVTQFV